MLAKRLRNAVIQGKSYFDPEPIFLQGNHFTILHFFTPIEFLRRKPNGRLHSNPLQVLVLGIPKPYRGFMAAFPLV